MNEHLRDKLFGWIKVALMVFLAGFVLAVLLLVVIRSDTDCDANIGFIDIDLNSTYRCVTFQINSTVSNNTYELVNKTVCGTNTTTFHVQQSALTFRNEMEILDINNQIIGSYYEINNNGVINYKYKYKGHVSSLGISRNVEYVMANIEKRTFLTSNRYILNRCDGTQQHEFRLVEVPSQIQDSTYNLFKDDVLIATTSDDNMLCKPSVYLTDLNTIIASLTRTCTNSIFVDNWTIMNFRPDIVDNYVVGFIAYITTLTTT